MYVLPGNTLLVQLECTFTSPVGKDGMDATPQCLCPSCGRLPQSLALLSQETLAFTAFSCCEEPSHHGADAPGLDSTAEAKIAHPGEEGLLHPEPAEQMPASNARTEGSRGGWCLGCMERALASARRGLSCAPGKRGGPETPKKVPYSHH